jgi:glycosyltransferase involved in cell wall biosynthesis
MTISAFIPVFNEEKRIKNTLNSLLWCDEIILIDKKSSDKTVEIASSFGSKVKIFFMDNSLSYETSEWELFLNNCSCEWVIFFTASNVIHPNLANTVVSIINNNDFHYDVINIPFRRYVLGIETKRSPWHSELSPKVFRKSVISIKKNGVHDALHFKGREYNLKYNIEHCMYHLTHETVDIMIHNHIRYWRGEAKDESINLNNSALRVIKEFFRIIFLRKSFLLGWDGIMLSFAYLTYFMMSFVYKWEIKRGRAPEKYKTIRKLVLDEWKINSEYQESQIKN